MQIVSGSLCRSVPRKRQSVPATHPGTAAIGLAGHAAQAHSPAETHAFQQPANCESTERAPARLRNISGLVCARAISGRQRECGRPTVNLTIINNQ